MRALATKRREPAACTKDRDRLTRSRNSKSRSRRSTHKARAPPQLYCRSRRKKDRAAKVLKMLLKKRMDAQTEPGAPVRNGVRLRWKGIAGLPKGGRARTVDLPQSLVDALKAYRHLKGPYVFCQPDGTALTPGLLTWPLHRALRRAGIARDQGRIGWHDLRHSYGSHLAMRGVPLKVIQELMGHASMEMTLKYAHLSPETKQNAVQVLDQPAPQSGLRHEVRTEQ